MLKLSLRMLRECRWRLLWIFAWNFLFKGWRAVRIFEKRLKRGEPFFPAFTVVSVTNRCNLSCRGCWVTQKPETSLSFEQLHQIIESSKRKGSCFFGLLGGEPLLWEPLFDIFKAHPECYFQLFTNGTLLTEAVARRLAECGNVTPLVSLEGLEGESDRRRGRDGVFSRTLSGVAACRKAGLITGVAASIGKRNFEELVTAEHLRFLAAAGVHYVWYYIYRPAGNDPEPENALSKAEILRLRRFIVESRLNAPLAIVDAYWDADGKAVCPGAMGLSHHISPEGALEFCPVIQFADRKLNARGDDYAECIGDDSYLADLRTFAAKDSRGCIFLENPQGLCAFAEKSGVFDSSLRGTFARELAHADPLPGHDCPGEEIPEKSILYRLAKRYAFFGFGAYG